VVSRLTIDRLSRSIDRLEQRFAPAAPPVELWLVNGNHAWLRDDNLRWTTDHKPDPAQAITYGELKEHLAEREARYADAYSRARWPMHCIVRFVHPGPCCDPGGACYAIHGDAGPPG
jgi:hypothetical protein